MRILVADDDLTLTRLLEDRLRERGHEVFVAQDAVEAWQTTQRVLPDIVLLDIKMPGGSGLNVLRRWKQNHKRRDIPIVVITAAEEPGSLQQALALQPDGLLRKPFQVAELELEITRLMAARTLAQAAATPPGKTGR